MFIRNLSSGKTDAKAIDEKHKVMVDMSKQSMNASRYNAVSTVTSQGAEWKSTNTENILDEVRLS